MKTGMSVFDKKLNRYTFAILDLETTGTSAEGRDRICEIAIAQVRGGEVRKIFDTLIDPGRKIPSRAYDIHKINDEMVEYAPRFDDIRHSIQQAVGDRIIVAHNATFDMRFLRRALGIEVAPLYFCTMAIERHLQDHIGSLALNHVAYKNKISRLGDPHTAGSDALLTANLFAVQIERLRRIGIHTIGQLFNIVSNPNVIQSFDEMFVHPPHDIGKADNLLSRTKRTSDENDTRQQYATHLVEAIKRKDSVDDVLEFQQDLDLTPEDIRFVHGKLIRAYLDRAMEDDTFHVGEKDQLDKLFLRLSKYGWVPGKKSKTKRKPRN